MSAVVAKQERKIRIHTGRGVQGTLTDALSKRIVADIVAPRFRNGDFAGGLFVVPGPLFRHGGDSCSLTCSPTFTTPPTRFRRWLPLIRTYQRRCKQG